MSQATRQFAAVEYIGNGPKLQAVTTRVPPGLNRRRVYSYLFVNWLAQQANYLLYASIHFLRGGVECAVLPLAANQTINVGVGGNPGSVISLASGGNAERDCIVIYPGSSIPQATLGDLGGPLAGEAVTAILQPFYMNVDADEFQLNIDVALNATVYRAWVGVFSDLLDSQGF
jgi:hypothetical protein